jgi:hypothetical protein
MSETLETCDSIESFAKLLQAFDVTLLLTDAATIECDFPISPDEQRGIDEANHRASANMATAEATAAQQPGAEDIRGKRIIRATIRSLVDNPRFMRLTTFAHYAHIFTFHAAKYSYGRIRTRKKNRQPFTFVFESQAAAERFFSDVENLLK